MRSYPRSFALAAFLILHAGCGDKSSSSGLNPISSPAESIAATNNSAEADIPQPDDKSLSDVEYFGAGMPAHDRIWSGDDITKAAERLAEISQNDARLLPRYQSVNSGKTFERLTSDENLSLYRNRSLPIERRFPMALNFMQATNQILKIYLAAFLKKSVSDSELVELMGVQLRMSVVMLGLVDELLPTFDKNDPTYEVRMNGLRQMKEGLGSIVAGSLTTLTERQAYRKSELKRFAGYMVLTFPDLLPKLPDASRTEASIRIKSFLVDPEMEYMRQELGLLADAANKTAESSKSNSAE